MTDRSPEPKTAAPPLPAATLMLVRDRPGGIEVFMVKRHHQIDFASGALVFPGGKVDPHDRDPQLAELCDGVAGLDEYRLSLLASAIREGFEESGILLARKPGATGSLDAKSATALHDWREKLNSGKTGLVEFLQSEGLRLSCDALVHFAHWVTPTMMPKRFDTHFYLAEAPRGQLGQHDGSELVDSVWVDPLAALDDKRWTIIFPTRLNLIKLGEARSVAEALQRARGSRIVTVEPKVITRDGKPFLTIPDDAGYGKIEEPMSSIRG